MKEDTKKNTKKPIDWNKVKTEYLSTNISYKEVGKKYGIPLRTIEDMAKREGWYPEKKKIRGKHVVEIANRIKDMMDKDLIVKEVDNNIKIALSRRNEIVVAFTHIYKKLMLKDENGNVYINTEQHNELMSSLEKAMRMLDICDKMFRRSADIDSLNINLNRGKTGYQALLESVGEDRLIEILNDPEAPDVA